MKKCFLRVAVKCKNDVEHLEIELKETSVGQNKIIEALGIYGMKIISVEYIERII